MAFKFMHAADIHLDSPLRGLERYSGAPAAEVRGATRQAFVKLIDDCLAQDVAFLLLVGDLFDGAWKDYNTGLFFTSQMARLKERGIKVFIVRGNHDAENTMTRSLRALDNMHVFSPTRPETRRLPELGVALHGQSYANTDVQHDLSAKYPPADPGAFNIGLLHTSADGSSKEHATYAPCSIQALVDRGYDYWALGHVHRRQVLRTDPLVVFPGNLQGRHVRETGPKGATLVTVTGAKATIEERHYDVMRWHFRSVLVEGARSASAAIDRVHEELAALREQERGRPLAVRVRLHGATDAHRELVGDVEKWTNEVRNCGAQIDDLWVEKVHFDTKTRIDLEALRQRPTPLGELLRTIEEARKDSDVLAELVKELATMQDKFAALDELDRPAFDRTETVRDALTDVEQLLIPLLLDGGEAS